MTASAPQWRRALWALVSVLGTIFLIGGAHMVTTAQSAGLSPLETQVLGQSRWLAGGPAALRVIVANHQTGTPLAAQVRLELAAQTGKARAPHRLFAGPTNAQGTLDATFTVPDLPPGGYDLRVTVDSALGQDAVVQSIQLEDKAQILLTTDKPLYQPGQTIHLRALALDLATREAVSGARLTFEVEDGRGNKVFKEAVALSAFGVAAAAFTLAEEVNQGTYHLRARLAQGEVEKTVRVERYVLPKFKVACTTDRPYYLPGDTVKGTVHAEYFFGKPVAGGTVAVQVVTVDVGVTTLGELKGETDRTGAYQFEFPLPRYLVGQALEQGKGMVDFAVAVTDGATHTQLANATVPVVSEPLTLALIPESRSLVPGLPNRLFVAAATPDGHPVKGTKLVLTAGTTTRTATTDDLGLATLTVVPGHGPLAVSVQAETPGGVTATLTQTLAAVHGQDGILLRANPALARVGERVNIAAIATGRSRTLYLDVIRNRQTILTRALPLAAGGAGTSLTLTPDMVGTLELHAYQILPSEEIIRDTQLLIVQPADDLQVRVTAGKNTYRPGEEATVSLAVTESTHGLPVQAALNLAIVDESVFALSELQPGLERIYFTLEKELLEPKYEIHGLQSVEHLLLESGGEPVPLAVRAARRQRAAEVLLAGIPAQGAFDLRVNTYQQRWTKLKAVTEDQMHKCLERIQAGLEKYRRAHQVDLMPAQGLWQLVREGYLRTGDLLDRWGTPYRTSLADGERTYDLLALTSAGPDRRWGTLDDLTVDSPLPGWPFGRQMAMAGRGEMLFDGAPVPLAMMAPTAPMATAAPATLATSSVAAGAPPAAPRVRAFFPETMYWHPAILTDARGKAEVTLPVADSITTWRMSLLANSIHGQLGSTTAPLRVFQDFFVDLDLPVALTQGDRVEVPVAIYNYLPTAQRVTVTLEMEPWFVLEGGGNEQTVQMGKDDVQVVYFPLHVLALGRHTLTLTARGTQLSDAIRRPIDILPNGKEIRTAVSDRLEGTVSRTITIPEEAIPGASAIWVKLYPGAFSQVVEGLDSLLRMPSGCFEQTSSTTYPNVLVLDYLKAQKTLKPELQLKAESYINAGYQRLVTFECQGGGFSWFGNEPAHQILTAYGLLEFSDMARVHEVDPALIQRTQRWLAGRQQPDGTWQVSESGIAEGIIDRQTGALRTTAYIAWALAESGYTGPAVGRARAYLTAHRGEATDPYTLAVLVNFFTRAAKEEPITDELAKTLLGKATVTEKTAYWTSGEAPTFTGATRAGADLETTGLAAFALVRWGKDPALMTKLLTHLIQSKDSFGTWSSTQGTVWALKSLLFASTHAVSGGTGTVTVRANGHEAARFAITEATSDVLRQVDLGGDVRPGANALTLEFRGQGALMYQIVGRYFVPWAQVPPAPDPGPLAITVTYDKTTLTQDDVVTATVTVKNVARPRATVEMPLVELGLPPGFQLLPESLERAVKAGRISKYTVAARQLIIYLEKLEADQTLTLTYTLQAKYPLRARTPASRAYPYYDPARTTTLAPQAMTVTRER
jgi:hypothetical protein